MPEKKEKNKFIKAIENFLYYYKWHTVIAIVFVIVLVGFIRLSDSTEPPSDVTVVSVFPRPLTMQEYTFEGKFDDSIIIDNDQNGKKQIKMRSIYISETGKSDGDVLGKSQFESVMAYGNADLVLLDNSNLERFGAKDFLEPLENYVDVSEFNEEDLFYRDGKAVAVRLRKSAVLTDMAFMIDNVYAGIMFKPEENKTIENGRKSAANMLLELKKVK
ncbi:MAG: hypothetical protein IKU87_01715 [Clostridia bacterium]|nr:hypothetical protein [Clostridia bacterium]